MTQAHAVGVIKRTPHACISRPNGARGLVTAAGPLLGAQVGEFLRLRGRWSGHPRYGRQFEMHSCATVLPATAAGIQKYLGSALIKGIGPASPYIGGGVDEPDAGRHGCLNELPVPAGRNSGLQPSPGAEPGHRHADLASV